MFGLMFNMFYGLAFVLLSERFCKCFNVIPLYGVKQRALLRSLEKSSLWFMFVCLNDVSPNMLLNSYLQSETLGLVNPWAAALKPSPALPLGNNNNDNTKRENTRDFQHFVTSMHFIYPFIHNIKNIYCLYWIATY